MAGNLKLSVRVDDPPWSDEVEEIENMAKIAKKYDCPLTLAIPTGWLEELRHLHKKYKEYHEKGLICVSCHGKHHEDFTGIGGKGKRLGKPLVVRGINLKEADRVLKECQEFSRSFFGRPFSLFIPPSRLIFPSWSDDFHNLLIKHGFKSISNVGGMDPLAGAFERTKGLYEIPFTIYVDFYRKKYAKWVEYTPEKFKQYVEVTKDHIRTRFRHGLYVCIMVHAINFDHKPQPEYGFAGKNPGGLYLDKILSWVEAEYKNVRFVGMEELVPRAR